MVQFDYKGENGFGHIIEGVDDAPDRDLDGEERRGEVGEKGGGEFPKYVHILLALISRSKLTIRTFTDTLHKKSLEIFSIFPLERGGNRNDSIEGITANGSKGSGRSTKSTTGLRCFQMEGKLEIAKSAEFSISYSDSSHYLESSQNHLRLSVLWWSEL